MSPVKENGPMNDIRERDNVNAPLQDLDALDDLRREQAGTTRGTQKTSEQFRDYAAEARAGVKEFYRLNHQYQTLDFVRAKKREYCPKTKRRMGIWEAMEFLNTLVDDSDPDTDLTQIEHLM